MSDQVVELPNEDVDAPKESSIQPVDPILPLQDGKRKRQDDDVKLKQPKLHKAAICPEPMPTKIMDLNVDCFECIFGHLGFMDLLNVANWNADSQKAAELVYSRRYSQYILKLNGYEARSCIMIDDEYLEITINTAKCCAKVLQCFGDVIKRMELLNFDAENLAVGWSEVERLINEKYTKTLCELKLSNCKYLMLDRIEEAFVNVESLRISCSRMGKLIDLGKWFPMLKRLQLLHNDRCIQTHSSFPYLSYLAMDIKDECLSTASFIEMLKSAPTLETLSLSGGMNSNHLQVISESLPNLRHLNLRNFLLSDEPEDVIIFKNVETLSISTGLIGMLPTEIPFTFEGLSELQVITADSLGWPWIDFAMKQTDLVKLRLESTDDDEVTDEHLAELAIALTKLKELEIFADISVDGVNHFLAESKMLQKLRIEISGQKDFSSLRESASREWHIHQKDCGWTFERKAK